MKHLDRPIQIANILSTICSGNNVEIGLELETYIMELEAKQPARPTRVTTILETIGSQYTTDMEMALEAYITHLEASQQSTILDIEPSVLPKSRNPPVWSHQRSVQRAQHRQTRILTKQNQTR